MGAVNECFSQVELAAFNEVIRECLQNVLQHSVCYPALEAPKARRIRGIPAGHVRPRGASPKDPQNAIEYIARIAPRSPTPVVSYLWYGEKLRDGCPLLIGEVHLDLRSQRRQPVDLCENTI